MKLHPFTSIEPLNHNEITADTYRHLRFNDYKALKNVCFDENDTEPLAIKIIASIGFIMLLLTLLFI